MWTSESVRGRFVEAAKIERRMYVKGLPIGGNAWPAYNFDEEERKGWVQEDIDEAKDRWAANTATTAPEIERWQQVYFIWTLQYIVKPIDCRRVWIWAKCVGCGPSFVSMCEKKGWVRRTEYARLERTFSHLAETLCNKRWPLQEAEILPLAQSETTGVINAQRMELRARVSHPPFRTEKHRHTLRNPAALAEFSKHLATTNEARRKLRQRKALRGVPGEQEAA